MTRLTDFQTIAESLLTDVSEADLAECYECFAVIGMDEPPAETVRAVLHDVRKGAGMGAKFIKSLNKPFFRIIDLAPLVVLFQREKLHPESVAAVINGLTTVERMRCDANKADHPQPDSEKFPLPDAGSPEHAELLFMRHQTHKPLSDFADAPELADMYEYFCLFSCMMAGNEPSSAEREGIRTAAVGAAGYIFAAIGGGLNVDLLADAIRGTGCEHLAAVQMIRTVGTIESFRAEHFTGKPMQVRAVQPKTRENITEPEPTSRTMH